MTSEQKDLCRMGVYAVTVVLFAVAATILSFEVISHVLQNVMDAAF